MKPVEVTEGNSPLVLGLPHTGTHVPADIWAHLNLNGQALSDTDWHIDRLYDDLLPGLTFVRATFHRYVIDANRDPGGASLYPGQNTTGLVPLTDFDGKAIWLAEPDQAEIESRRKAYHAPYHAALAAQLARAQERHGFALLYDCHSIRSHIPYLFDSTLPDLNIGTNSSLSCDSTIETTVQKIAETSDHPTVLNGRFKGGWTTRRYGQPAAALHAVQMELAQSTYLIEEAPPWRYDETKAARLRVLLRSILSALAAWRPR